MNLKSDVDTIYKYMRETLKLRGKIGIFGRSLGGIPASFMSDRV